jgi:hypothetical protein
MWRPGAAIAALLLALVMASVFHRGEQTRAPGRQESAPASKAVARGGCGKAVLRDLVDNGQIDRDYAQGCYQSALRLLPEDGPPPEALIVAVKGPTGY